MTTNPKTPEEMAEMLGRMTLVEYWEIEPMSEFKGVVRLCIGNNACYIRPSDARGIAALRNMADGLRELWSSARGIRAYLKSTFSPVAIEHEERELRETGRCSPEYAILLDLDRILNRLSSGGK